MIVLLFAIFGLSPGNYMPNEVVVKFRNGVDASIVLDLNTQLGTETMYTSPYLGFQRIKIPRDKTVEEMVELYRQDPNVEYAEPNAVLHAFWTPNDPYFSYQWHFDANHLNMEAAWSVEQGGNSSVVVAVIDAGVAYEDYSIPSSEMFEVSSRDGRYHRAPDLANTNFVAGYDFINNDPHPNDENGHGTHVAGTIAQSTNNRLGCAGMAFRSSIMPVRVLDHTGSGPSSAIADGISFAAENGADVINMSLGGEPGNSSGMETVHQAIINAVNQGVVVVAATGNENASLIAYPAGFSECIAVGATDYLHERAPYSNWGSGIDIVAPGGDISVDRNGDSYPDGVLQQTYIVSNDGTNLAQVDSFSYWFFNGTSMATPHVAGLVALMIGHGITGVGNIKNTLFGTAQDLGPSGYDQYYGYGIIDPVAALGQEPGELTIALPIIQNPTLDQYIDVWVVPSIGLQSEPAVGIKVGSDSTGVTMNQVTGSTAYQGNYRFTGSGTATVYVSADGIDTSRTFSVSLIVAEEGGVVVDPNKKVELTFLPGAMNRTSYITIIPDTGVCAYTIGPAGIDLKNPGLLSFSYDPEDLAGNAASKLGIYYSENGSWHYLGGMVDRTRHRIELPVTTLGSYALKLDPNGPDAKSRPFELVLAQNSPNPFRNATVIKYQVPTNDHITLRVYDALGRQVRNLVDGEQPMGAYEITWDGKGETGENQAAGIYFYRLLTGGQTVIKKMVLLQ